MVFGSLLSIRRPPDRRGRGLGNNLSFNIELVDGPSVIHQFFLPIAPTSLISLSPPRERVGVRGIDPFFVRRGPR
jgi:hypothetical protein